MTANELFARITEKQSFLCVGLDTDLKKIPQHLLAAEDPAFEFNKAIIDATAPYTVAYKPNAAFYEALGTDGWNTLFKTVDYIRKNYPEIFIIADAKRGDIGNTSKMYAQAFFEKMDVDGVTLAPYMGKDTVAPFLEYDNRWAVILALTSNGSAADFELSKLEDGRFVFEQVLEKAASWGNADNTMFVVGATQAAMLTDVRRIVPDHFLLVPGVGAQGGSLEEVARYGMNSRCGLLVNSSRAIIYADQSENFAQVAGQCAQQMQQDMARLLTEFAK
ncbi:MAG: orotidine-5'-phosphate decarboxylase [Rikenellaceae bacterium]|nr:orotidine-5'-phosphate decarboxylase [Rikenellaceae bacterium]